jgi:hypothetical protein
MPLGYATWSTTLTAALTAKGRRAVLANVTAAPAAPFVVKIDSEYVLVTRLGRSGAAGLVRGLEGSTPAAHSAGAIVRHPISAGTGTHLQRLAVDGPPDLRALPVGVRAYQYATAR